MQSELPLPIWRFILGQQDYQKLDYRQNKTGLNTLGLELAKIS